MSQTDAQTDAWGNAERERDKARERNVARRAKGQRSARIHAGTRLLRRTSAHLPAAVIGLRRAHAFCASENNIHTVPTSLG